MQNIALNICLNTEVKWYGLSFLGLIGAFIIGALIWLKFGMIFGIIGISIGYAISASIAKAWHTGLIQRFVYWHLNVKVMFGCKYLPCSFVRCLM